MDIKMVIVLGKDNVRIFMIEYLFLVVYVYGIDNFKIFVDNEEIFIMDGSVLIYCMFLDEVGIKELDVFKKVMEIK